MRGVTRAGVLRVGADPDEFAAVGGQLAATEAITAVGGDGQTRAEAHVALASHELLATRVAAWDFAVGVVAAARIAARRVTGSH